MDETKGTTFAFVGQAGTGKSQRAQMMASYLNADYIIDDGLVIRKGQIICGKSAKSERNQVRAIRRALFEYEDHKKTVSDFFKSAQPCCVLIIATSEDMARRIAKKLDLPPVGRFLHIEDVATKEEISRARKERLLKGQHVIPVSHVAVQKNFAGKLVGKLRVLWRAKDKYEGEKSVVRPPFSFYGDVHIETEAIEQLASGIAMMTPQVKKVAQVKVRTHDEDDVMIYLELSVIIGDTSFTKLAQQIKERVSKSVRYFSGLDVKKVDIFISEVIFNGNGRAKKPKK